MNWTLDTTLRLENQPASAPVIYITGETLVKSEDVDHLGQLIAESVFNGENVSFRSVVKGVNLDWGPKDGPGKPKAALRTMLANLAELNTGGALAKGTTFVFTMPNVAEEERYLFMRGCKLLTVRRESTLLHLHLETTMVDGAESLTIKLQNFQIGSRKHKVDLLLQPQDAWQTTVRRIHDTLCSLVSVKERTHLIKGDFLEFNDAFRPQATWRMTIAEVCSAESTEFVQFACLIETWPVWDPEAGVLTMRICDRTASVNIVFRNLDEDAIDMTFIFTLEPGSAKQLACDVARTPSPSSNRRFFSSITEASSRAVPATKGFLQSARASIVQKFHRLRK